MVFWAIFVLYWFVSAFGIKRDIGHGPWWQAWWVRIVLTLVILGVLARRAHLGPLANNFRWDYTPFPGVLAWLGVILTGLGIAFAIWARMHLGRNWSPAPALKENHELVTSGPYAYVRHPIYTGILAAMLGTGFVNVSWLAVFVVAGATFLWRVKREEVLMMQKFPDTYPEYKKRTRALIPFIY